MGNTTASPNTGGQMADKDFLVSFLNPGNTNPPREKSPKGITVPGERELEKKWMKRIIKSSVPLRGKERTG